MIQAQQNHFSGGAAEYYAASWFLENGYQVWWPSVQSDAADFVVSRDGIFSRIQVKKASWSGRRGSARQYLQITLHRPPHRGREYRIYDKTVIDFIVAVDGARLWLIPVEAVKNRTGLQLDKRGARLTNYPERATYNPALWRIA